MHYAERDQRISIHALRGAGDLNAAVIPSANAYFYPRPPWGGRRLIIPLMGDFTRISIHALLGEGDRVVSAYWCARQISIHALRGEGDLKFHTVAPLTRPISIHALRGEGDTKATIPGRDGEISIHALRGEGDP